MSDPVTVRPARPADAPGIARVYVETWRNAYPGVLPHGFLVGMSESRQAVQWDALIRRARPPGAVLVAEMTSAHGRQVIGLGNCGRARRGPHAGEVYTLYVANDYQGLGVGRRLLGGLFAALARGGVGDALVWVLSGNPARFFYQAMGGAPVATRREPFAGEILDETAYAWPDLSAWLAEHAGREE